MIMISAVAVIVILTLNGDVTSSNIQTKNSYTASKIELRIANTRDDLSVDASTFKRPKWIGGNGRTNWLTDTDFETSKRVKRDDDDYEVIWDNCPGELHYAVIDGELQCVAGDVATGISDRITESLVNCPKGTRKVILPGGVKMCLERRRRRKNT